MTDAFTARHLYNSLHAPLQLRWAAGAAGQDRAFGPVEAGETGTTLVGHLNLIHPYRIQVLGPSELTYLERLGKNSYDDAVKHLFSGDTSLVIVANDLKAPADLLDMAERGEIPFLCSRLESHRLITHLQYFMGNLLAEKTTMHGVFMEVMGIGVLLSGESSIGKSELALELITRGHRLIADDAPEFTRVMPDTISGTCPDLLREFLEVRGLGVINVRTMFGDSAIKNTKYLRLVIRLEAMDDERLRGIDRLQGSRSTRKILGVDVPEISLPVAPGRNLAVLVETAVRNHIQNMKGYDACADFVARQHQAIGHSDES